MNYDEPNTISVLHCPEPDHLFRSRILETTTSELFRYALICGDLTGEELDTVAGMYGYRRLELVDFRYEEAR